MPSPPDLAGDPVELTAWLVDQPTPSGSEGPLAEAIQTALLGLGHLDVRRDGDAVLARTGLGRERRVLLAGHLDTVPVAGNVPSRREDGRIHGCGASDMKSALAVMLHLAAVIRSPRTDLTFVFYDHEEVEAAKSGLGRLERAHPDWLDADLAIVMEPTNAIVEAGCQGTMRAVVSASGRRAHSARSWLGDNAIHHLAAALVALEEYVGRIVTLDECTYREGLSAVGIAGGVAGNVIPDAASVTVNFRSAPDRSEAAAEEHLREVFSGYELTVLDSAPGALPRLGDAAAHEFLEAVGAPPVAKYGWTDVARFAARGVPALNFGPGDPELAHTRSESVEIGAITRATAILRSYLEPG